MTATLYVPRDSGALSLGAEHVARAIAQEAARRKIDVTIVRNGSRGLYWLEPMVEAATARGRVAYGPVRPKRFRRCSTPASSRAARISCVWAQPRKSPISKARSG